jgi:hypothetical protein
MTGVDTNGDAGITPEILHLHSIDPGADIQLARIVNVPNRAELGRAINAIGGDDGVARGCKKSIDLGLGHLCHNTSPVGWLGRRIG